MHFRILFAAFLFLAIYSPTQLAAQCYTTFRQDGIDLYNKGKWSAAKAEFQEAANCKSDKPVINDLSSWIGKCDKKLAEARERDRQRREQEEADRLAQQQAATTRAADDSFWEALKDGGIADCDKYLRKYANGRHASEARKRKEALTPVPVKPSTPPLTTPATNSNTAAFRDCSECPLMMPVDGGTYSMGSPTAESGRSNDECQHQETVTSFSIGVYEVTVEEYLRFADATNGHYPEWLEKGNSHNVETGSSSYYKDKGYTRNAKNLPVCGVNWDDAVAYCEWLSRKTGKKYHLPLEKEWEYAAKGGKKTRTFIYAGSNDVDAVAWYETNAGAKPHTVGGKAANELGLYDMSGNVWEWCQDKWGAYPNCTADNCAGCAVLRGGSWFIYDFNCRSAYRIRFTITSRNYFYGFRCAREGQ